MTMHSLAKSGLFFAVGHIAQVKGTQRIAEIGGLTVSHPALGWGMVILVLAIGGAPPLGIFMSEFLVVTSTFSRAPLLAVVLVLGIAIGFAGLVYRIQPVAFGEPRGPVGPIKASLLPLATHILLVAIAGIWLPEPLANWFRSVAGMLG
jgi:hydrogenase-4 component F